MESKLNNKEAVKHIQDVKAKFLAQLARLGKEASVEALKQSRWALQLNVYGTEPGEYQRTGTLGNSLFSDSSVQGMSVRVTLGDSAEYARFVNYGTPEISSTAAENIAQKYGPNLIKTGRSGKKYMLPASYIEPALYSAGQKVDFEQALKNALGVK